MSDYKLSRRGHELGEINIDWTRQHPLENWHSGHAVRLPSFCKELVSQQQTAIHQTENLVHGVWNEQGLENILNRAPYQQRLSDRFVNLGSSINEHDQQEIETVFFDGLSFDELAFDGLENSKVVAEDLWMKTSWLSFFDEDASLRFRFSFGVDLEENVAADPLRQKYAGILCDKIFPESSIITEHGDLNALLRKLLDKKQVQFVERIVYFNAANGGAYLHHDLERGHAGVVYAQITGKTFWLALAKFDLIERIIEYANQYSVSESIKALCAEPEKLASELDSFANDELIKLINETQQFIHYLHEKGHSVYMQAGDILLLPQTSLQQCCWHSVFSLGEEVGQALSFAIR